MDKPTLLFDEVCDFINKHNISCIEDVYQRETVADNCIDLVAELVEIILSE